MIKQIPGTFTQSVAKYFFSIGPFLFALFLGWGNISLQPQITGEGSLKWLWYFKVYCLTAWVLKGFHLEPKLTIGHVCRFFIIMSWSFPFAIHGEWSDDQWIHMNLVSIRANCMLWLDKKIQKAKYKKILEGPLHTTQQVQLTLEVENHTARSANSENIYVQINNTKPFHWLVLLPL